MKSPTPEAQCAEGTFQIQCPICAVIFTNKISRSIDHDTTFENLTINFRNNYFHNFIDWSGHYLPVYIPS